MKKLDIKIIPDDDDDEGPRYLLFLQVWRIYKLKLDY